MALPESDQSSNQQQAAFLRRQRRNSVVRYAFLPGILPRLRHLGSMMGNFAYVLAVIFRSARLLPPNHPMLTTANIGRFGISDVVATAANNLELKRANTDQIMIFGAIMLAILMVIGQVLLVAFLAFFGTAHAADTGNMFTTPNPDDDVVLTFLQHAVGLNGFFNSATPVGFTGNVALGLHQMLKFYSTGMMIIAVIIVLYYVITVVGESAQSGTPFGRRFNGLWAPVRLVLALGLLVPLGSGLNSAQYVALATAKAGSGLATQAWSKFAENLKNEKNYKIKVAPYGSTNIGKSIFLYEVCMAAYNKMNPGSPMTYSGATATSETIVTPNPNSYSAMGDPTGVPPDTKTVPYIDFNWSKAGDTSGRYRCGRIRINEPSKSGSTASYATIVDATSKAYQKTIDDLHAAFAPRAALFVKNYVAADSGPLGASVDDLPKAEDVIKDIQTADTALLTAFNTGSQFSQAIVDELKLDELDKNGWGNAAAYYTRLAYATQKIQSIVSEAAPKDLAPTNIIKETADENDKANVGFFMSFFTSSKSTIGQDQALMMKTVLEAADRRITSQIPDQSVADVPGKKFYGSVTFSESPLKWFILNIFGLDSLRQLYDGTGEGVFPMVLLTNVGTSIVTHAEKAFVLGAGTALAGSIPFVGAGVAALSSLIFTFGFIGIGVGFLLAYLLPLMPFIYFFFAIVEWVMSVVEALIGAPLWALAHLRIDGEGMPGQAAMNGYMIMLGILLKPILITFGLITSYILFNAGAAMLNVVFGNAAKIIQDGPTDSAIAFVAYFLVYAVICYNLGLVCFKMIDQIPAQSMRWLGQSNLNYQDGKPDPIGNAQGVVVGFGGFLGSQVGQGVAGGMSKAVDGYRGAGKERAAAAEGEKRHKEMVSAVRGTPPP